MPMQATAMRTDTTCLKWTRSGELTNVDLLNILERLAAVDANMAVMDHCHLDEQPTAAARLSASATEAAGTPLQTG